MAYNRNLILLFHILFVGPLFLYVGLMKSKMHNILRKIIIGLGVIVVLYHSYMTCK